MIKTLAFLASSSLVLICNVAFAGTLTGSVQFSGDKVPEKFRDAVIWIDGIENFDIPETNAVISQKDVAFHPEVTVITAGQTVDMPNNDDIAHNVFSFSKNNKFKLGLYPKGESRAVKFPKSGVSDIFCSLHRTMHAKVVVTTSPYSAKTPLGSKYSIKDIPAGDYKIRVWNAHFPMQSHAISIPEEGEISFDLLMKK